MKCIKFKTCYFAYTSLYFYKLTQISNIQKLKTTRYTLRKHKYVQVQKVLQTRPTGLMLTC